MAASPLEKPQPSAQGSTRDGAGETLRPHLTEIQGDEI